MANLYVSTEDKAELVTCLAFRKELLLDDQADDSTVNRIPEIAHIDKLLQRINTMGG